MLGESGFGNNPALPKKQAFTTRQRASVIFLGHKMVDAGG
jgi:hypothetical protein